MMEVTHLPVSGSCRQADRVTLLIDDLKLDRRDCTYNVITH